MRNELTAQELQDRVEVEVQRLVAAGETFTATTVTKALRAAAPGDNIPHRYTFDAGGDPVPGVQDLVHDYMSAWMTANPGRYERVTSDELSAPHMAEHYRPLPVALPDPTPAVVTVTPISVPQVVWGQ